MPQIDTAEGRLLRTLITAPHLSVQYWGPHFDLPNIVAHVRSTERTTPEGARLLVLEEIQSDWNQELRAVIQEARRQRPVDDAAGDSFDWDDVLQPPPFNPYLNHWLEVALRMLLLVVALHSVLEHAFEGRLGVARLRDFVRGVEYMRSIYEK